MSYYVHAVPGRLRVRIPGLKGRPAEADRMCRRLMELPGVDSVSANRLTGSLLVNHNPARIDTKGLLAEMSRRGYIDESRTTTMDDYLQAKAQLAGRFLARTLTGLFMGQALAGTELAFLSVLL